MIKVGDKVITKSSKTIFTIAKIENRRVYAKEFLLHTDIELVELYKEA